MLTPDQVHAAVKTHGTIFFDAQLNPVTPQIGQWFCEYELVIPEEGDDFLRDDALVEYTGPDDRVVWCDKAGAFVPYGDPIRRHRVAPEYSDCDRRVQGEILIRQT
jgi:hypothetical protein